MAEKLRSYHGRVRPHPSLEVLLSEQATPLSNRANLAVIVLEQPVDDVPMAPRLPSAEVTLAEPFTIAGYGFDGRSDLIQGRRRFGRKKITRLPMTASEEILFEPAGTPFTTGSGEPCLVEGGKEPMLVGVTTLDSKDGPAFTSTFPHREWILSELGRPLPSLKTPSRSKDSAR